jgi:transposase
MTAEEAEDKLRRLNIAKEKVQEGMSQRKAAQEYGLPRTTLQDFLNAGPSKKFKPSKGRVCKVMSREESLQIEEFVQYRAKMGFGMSYEQLQQLIQEGLQRLVSTDPSRVTGFESDNQLPPRPWVYRFVKRGTLVLRQTMELTVKRSVITVTSIGQWFKGAAQT